MTWNIVHNFPASKDTYEVPVNYPDAGYDTIIAAWFTDIFTSILAMQDALLSVGIFSPVWTEDIEVSDKTKGLILKSPNNSRFRVEVSDGGVLSTEAL